MFLNQLMRKLLIEGQITGVEGEPLSELKLLKQPLVQHCPSRGGWQHSPWMQRLQPTLAIHQKLELRTMGWSW